MIDRSSHPNQGYASPDVSSAPLLRSQCWGGNRQGLVGYIFESLALLQLSILNLEKVHVHTPGFYLQPHSFYPALSVGVPQGFPELLLLSICNPSWSLIDARAGLEMWFRGSGAQSAGGPGFCARHS